MDTNLLIDEYSHVDNYKEFLDALQKANVKLVSLEFVKFEFVRSKTIDVVRRKEEHFSKLISKILLLDEEVEKAVIPVMEEYKQYMEGLPLTDLVLGACLKRYSGLYLLTRDHTDFPTTVFDRLHIFNIEGIRDIRTYGVYAYHQ